jgi:glucose-1-phosphate thymidylyltransferase
MTAPQREIVGLIPAAGKAAHMGPLPCSKKLYPIGFRSVGYGQSLKLYMSHVIMATIRSGLR